MRNAIVSMGKANEKSKNKATSASRHRLRIGENGIGMNGRQWGRRGFGAPASSFAPQGRPPAAGGVISRLERRGERSRYYTARSRRNLPLALPSNGRRIPAKGNPLPVSSFRKKRSLRKE